MPVPKRPTTDLPDGTPEARYWADLRRLEREARAENLGAWAAQAGRGSGRSVPSIPDIPEQEVALRRSATVRDVEPPFAAIGILRRGSRVLFVQAVTPVQARIRFEANGETREALCDLADLEIPEH